MRIEDCKLGMKVKHRDGRSDGYITAVGAKRVLVVWEGYEQLCSPIDLIPIPDTLMVELPREFVEKWAGKVIEDPQPLAIACSKALRDEATDG